MHPSIRLLIVLLVFGSQAALSAPRNTPPESPQQQLDRGAELLNQAAHAIEQGDLTSAEKALISAVRLIEESQGKSSPFLGPILIRLAEVRAKKGQRKDASALLHRALRVTRDGLGPDHEFTARATGILAEFLLYNSDLGDAAPLYEQLTRIYTKTHGPGSPAVVSTLANLAELYAQRGEHLQAHQTYARHLDW
jgi:tetratricopeptide (TPR) repeat protein